MFLPLLRSLSPRPFIYGLRKSLPQAHIRRLTCVSIGKVSATNSHVRFHVYFVHLKLLKPHTAPGLIAQKPVHRYAGILSVVIFTNTAAFFRHTCSLCQSVDVLLSLEPNVLSCSLFHCSPLYQYYFQVLSRLNRQLRCV